MGWKLSQFVFSEEDLRNEEIPFHLFIYHLNKKKKELNSICIDELEVSFLVTGKQFLKTLDKKNKKKFLSLLSVWRLKEAALTILQNIAKENKVVSLKRDFDCIDPKEKVRKDDTIFSETFLYVGKYFEKSVESLALEFYQTALSLGNKTANYFFASLLETKNEEIALEKSLEHYKLASQNGHLKSTFKIALEKFKEEKLSDSFEIFVSLAERGCISSLNNICYFYLQGIVVEKDLLKAYKILDLASSLGSKTAKWNLALMYHNHNTLVKDELKSRKLFKQSGLRTDKNKKLEFKLEENLKNVVFSFRFPKDFFSCYLEEVDVYLCEKSFKETCKCVHCSQRKGFLLQICLPGKKGKRIFNFDQNSTIYSIKKYVEIKDNLTVDTLRASLNGKVLSDCESLKNLKIKQNSVMKLDFIEGYSKTFSTSNIVVTVESEKVKMIISTKKEEVKIILFIYLYFYF